MSSKGFMHETMHQSQNRNSASRVTDMHNHLHLHSKKHTRRWRFGKSCTLDFVFEESQANVIAALGKQLVLSKRFFARHGTMQAACMLTIDKEYNRRLSAEQGRRESKNKSDKSVDLGAEPFPREKPTLSRGN